MRRTIASFVIAALVGVTCAQYQSQGVRLLSQIPLNQFPGNPVSGSAIYGYTSPSGREYAVMGLRNGNSIVDITNETAPVQIAHIPGPDSLWHENVVLNGYCYAVSDGNGAIGIQIINLNDADSGNVNLDATYNGQAAGKNLSNVHTIQADPTTNRLFANGSNRGFVIFNASNPTNIVELGRWTTAYVHDSLIKNFTSGPYAGKQIAYLFCGTSGMYIVDVTNPANIVTLGNTQYYPGAGNNTYCHSGSLSPDAKYMMINDEFDENKNLTTGCTTVILNVENLATPTKVGAFVNPVNTIDHNSQIRDGFLFLSAYKGGLRIYNASNPLNLFETGWIDTYPSSTNVSSYEGNWGVYALYPSRNVALSDINRGLFVVDPSEAIGLGAPIISANWLSTVVQSGNVKSLRENDGNTLSCIPLSRSGFDYNLIFDSTVTPRNTLDILVRAKGNSNLRLFLKNRSTGNYDQVYNDLLNSSSFTNHVVNGISASTYVNSAGEVDMRVQSKSVAISVLPVEFEIVRLTVNR